MRHRKSFAAPGRRRARAVFTGVRVANAETFTKVRGRRGREGENKPWYVQHSLRTSSADERKQGEPRQSNVRNEDEEDEREEKGEMF